MIFFLSPWNLSSFGMAFTWVLILVSTISLRCHFLTMTSQSEFLVCCISCICQITLTLPSNWKKNPFSHFSMTQSVTGKQILICPTCMLFIACLIFIKILISLWSTSGGYCVCESLRTMEYLKWRNVSCLHLIRWDKGPNKEYCYSSRSSTFWKLDFITLFCFGIYEKWNQSTEVFLLSKSFFINCQQDYTE